MMRRIGTLLLAVLLLLFCPVVSHAEGAPALDLRDPVLDLAIDGDLMHLDFNGVTLRFGVLDRDEDGAELVLNILGRDELLFTAAARFMDGKVLLTADGLSHSYSLLSPSGGLSGIGSGVVGAVQLPTLDSEVLQKIIAEAELGFKGGAITFRLPYTSVTKLLKEILPMVQIPNREALLELLTDAEANGDGVELSGSVAMADGVRLELRVTQVESGVIDEQPLAIANFDLKKVDNGADFTLSLTDPNMVGEEQVLRVEGSLRSGNDRSEFHLKIFVPGQSPFLPFSTLDLVVDQDFTFRFRLDDFHVEASFTHTDGLLILALQSSSLQGRLTVTAVSGSAELQTCSFPSREISLNGLTDVQEQELMQELSASFSRVIAFLIPVLAEAGLS